MERKFTTFVIDELRELIDDLEAGRQPRNLVLHTGVIAWLRTQFKDARASEDFSGDICSPDDSCPGDDDEPL